MYGVQMGEDGGFVLHPDIPDAKGKAKLIVLACNYHDELVHMLQMVLRDLDRRLLPSGTLTVRELVRDLLSRIEGEHT